MASTAELFSRDLESLSGTYDQESLEMVRANSGMLLDKYEIWGQALEDAAKALQIDYSDASDIPYLLESVSVSNLVRGKADKVVIGMAGPGATGKETVTKALGFPKAINATTRAMRGNDVEREGREYNFVTDEQFRQMDEAGAFLTTTVKPGRGSYGVQRAKILEGLANSDAVTIEEAPEALFRLSKIIGTSIPGSRFELVYLLPQHPVLLNLAARLAGRCRDGADDYPSVIESTLGSRQVDEFKSLFTKNEGTPIVFVVNDQVERAKEVILKTISP